MSKVQCGSCRGTGLYVGFAEPSGEAVICLNCNGTGARDADDVPRRGSTPFTGRKLREGIRTVRHSRGTFVLSCGGMKEGAMTYQEFLDRYPEG